MNKVGTYLMLGAIACVWLVAACVVMAACCVAAVYKWVAGLRYVGHDGRTSGRLRG